MESLEPRMMHTPPGFRLAGESCNGLMPACSPSHIVNVPGPYVMTSWISFPNLSPLPSISDVSRHCHILTCPAALDLFTTSLAMGVHHPDDTLAAAPPMDMVAFTVIVDDIAFPDGRTTLGCLGGGGPQAAFGARLWLSNGERVGLAAGIGADFPDSLKDWLKTVGIDTSGLVLWPSRTLRTWQFSESLNGSGHNTENEEKQTEILRVTEEGQSWEMMLPELNLLPPAYQKAKTYHVGVHPSGLDVPFLRALRNAGVEILSVEVYTHAEVAVPHFELQALVSTCHIFSPNEREAASLVGAGTPMQMIERLSNLGAEIVVLRRGHLGSIVHRSDTKETWDVPAFHTLLYQGSQENGDTNVTKTQNEAMSVKAMLDPTGCGNTFCGSFLAGWYKTRNLLTAALWGSVSASFMLEYEGVPPPSLVSERTAAQLRLNLLRPHAKQIICT